MSKARRSVAIAGLLVVLVGPGVAMADAPEFKTANRTPAYLWVTIYGISSGGPNRQIFTAGCVPPGSTKDWTTRGHSYISISGIYWIRAEMTRKPDCQRPPVDCDTTMEVRPDPKGNPEYLLRANATNCWWEKKTK